MNSERLDSFLRRNGWGDAARAPLTGDASFRSYLRLTRGGDRAVLMVAGPPNEDVRPFLGVGAFLVEHGFSAPRVLAADEPNGLLLLEDLGDDSYARLLARGEAPQPLYAAAVDVLALLHRFTPPDLAVYDESRIIEEGRILPEWYLPALTGRPSPSELFEEYAALWRQVLPLAGRGNAKRVLVLRDYFADNLMWLPGRNGIARVGLLDFQDAVVGPAAYDLVSLLQDSRRALPPAMVEMMINRYADVAGISDRDAFRTAYTVLGAQRNARIVGLWPRLWKRDGKPQYLRFLDHTWRLLEADLAHPALASLRLWFDRVIPPEQRHQPLPGQP